MPGLDSCWMTPGSVQVLRVMSGSMKPPPPKLQQGQGIHTKLSLAAYAPTDPGLIQGESKSIFGMSTKPTGYRTTMCPTLCGYKRETEWVSSHIRTLMI